MTVYNDDPVAVAKEFESAGAQMIHVVDLDGAFNGTDSPNREVVKKIVESVTVPIEVGGGIRTIEDMQDLTKPVLRALFSERSLQNHRSL